MNVLILSRSIWPEGSGGELATYLYIKLLIENDVNVKVATSSTPNYFKAWNELPIYKIPVLGYGKYTIVPMFKKLRELFEWSDIVYCTDFFPIIPLIKRAFKKPVVAHIHSYFPACPIGSLYNLKEDSTCKPDDKNCSKCIWYYERAYTKPFSQASISMLLNSTIRKGFLNFVMLADALVFVSNAQRNLFLKHAPNLPCQLYVIYNPLPGIPYIPVEGDDLGYFGGFSPLKGFHVLVKALSKIRNEHKTMLYATKMEGLVNLDLFARIGIVPYGMLDNDSYENVYRKVKIVVHPSIWQEPLPYVVIEALLRGRLLVASHVGGVPEIIRGLSGVLMTEPNDVDGLAGALDQAISIDRSKAIELGLKNRESVLKKFDNQRSVSELIRVFERVSS